MEYSRCFILTKINKNKSANKKKKKKLTTIKLLGNQNYDWMGAVNPPTPTNHTLTP